MIAEPKPTHALASPGLWIARSVAGGWAAAKEAGKRGRDGQGDRRGRLKQKAFREEGALRMAPWGSAGDAHEALKAGLGG